MMEELVRICSRCGGIMEEPEGHTPYCPRCDRPDIPHNFRVGDKVTRVIIQQGIIEDDMSFNRALSDQRYWYQGHNLDIKVKEKKPERKKKMYGFTYMDITDGEIDTYRDDDFNHTDSCYNAMLQASERKVLTDIFEYEVDE